jgi:outer membrane lipoprotein-sorting protein
MDSILSELRRFWWSVMLLVLASSAARAQTPEEMLQAVDRELIASNDQYLLWEIVTVIPGKTDRRMVIEVTIKGQHWRRVEFLEPADIKGMKLLVRSPTQMYIYLPAFRKVRRLASHVQDQGFMGTAFDHDEISLAIYGEVFTAESLADGGDTWVLTLKRRPDQRFHHAGVRLTVTKDRYQPVKIDYLNDSGEVNKVETRESLTCSGSFCTPRIVSMVDHTRGGIKTVMTLKKTKFNTGVPDSFFTVHALQRGP